MDKVIIKNLLARGIIGVNDWERNRAQNILINLTLFTDTSRAAETDHIDDCVNYSTMSKKVMAHAESAPIEYVDNACSLLSLPGKGLAQQERRGQVDGSVFFPVFDGSGVEG